MVVLGDNPQDLTVQLAYDSDFVAVLESRDSDSQLVDYPTGTAISLEIKSANTTTTWNAVVAASQATFNVDKVAVNTLLDAAGAKTARLFYENGTDRRLWASGKVKEIR